MKSEIKYTCFRFDVNLNLLKSTKKLKRILMIFKTKISILLE